MTERVRHFRGEIWTTDLCVPISVPKTLLPTFLNTVSARQYALVLRVAVAGLKHGRVLEVTLPLQLIFCDQSKSQEAEYIFASGLQNIDEYVSPDNHLPPPVFEPL